MNKNLYSYFFILLFLVFFTKITKSQVYDTLHYSCGKFQKIQVEITVPDNSYRKIRNSRGTKISFSKVQMHFNGQKIPVKSIKIRGKTTLYFPKKSFTLKLKDHLNIERAGDTVSQKDYYLLSLTMDQNYIVNHLAYSLLKTLNIFNLTFHYCEVLINGETQGIYMIMERPRDYAFETLKSPVLIRRGYDNKIDEINLNDKVYNGNSKYFQKKFDHLYSLGHKYSGARLYDSLNCCIDLDQYMRWLGFNFLVKNGDYTDELFLYYDTSRHRFGIIPWDYDDLFMQYPHEGRVARSAVKGGQFIFSSEDRLDQTIIGDKYLYKKYLEEMANTTEQLNDKVLFKIFQDTYCSVYPYYLDDEIIQSTQFDKYGLTNKDELYDNMEKKWIALSSMRDMIKQYLKTEHKTSKNKSP